MDGFFNMKYIKTIIFSKVLKYKDKICLIKTNSTFIVKKIYKRRKTIRKINIFIMLISSNNSTVEYMILVINVFFLILETGEYFVKKKKKFQTLSKQIIQVSRKTLGRKYSTCREFTLGILKLFKNKVKRR